MSMRMKNRHLKVEHIGIAVNDLNQAIDTYETLLNTQCYRVEEVLHQKTKTAFFKTQNTKIELLEAMEQDSVIANYIQQKGEGIHHIAFEVEDINLEMERLSKEGFQLLYKEAQQGADQKLVNFIHPKDANSVLIELCQSI